MSQTTIRIVEGDLLAQPVEVIVNAWNRNIIPWWLLLPQGVSGAIKRQGGYAPFRALAKYGAIPLGGAGREKTLMLMQEEIGQSGFEGEVVIVVFKRRGERK
ncbi:hypothetical protein FACS1894116_05440 [Betaproteobacteria bacterium]|nr:hypothetical protein FACS1894116_05440 [Betaproteobacteria bacterium]GHT97707.1 hypothetical protein FACS1894154_01680 [Betaproteobacteria bacterium]GHU28783.1 hypothetical protein FACS189497_05140 [Betaproteobacteria bacterium]